MPFAPTWNAVCDVYDAPNWEVGRHLVKANLKIQKLKPFIPLSPDQAEWTGDRLLFRWLIDPDGFDLPLDSSITTPGVLYFQVQGEPLDLNYRVLSAQRVSATSDLFTPVYYYAWMLAVSEF